MRVLIGISIFFFWFSSEARSQIVNIQAALSGDVSQGLGLSAEIRQESRQCNSETDRLAGQGTLTYNRPRDLWVGVLRRDYCTESGQSSADSRFLHLRYRYRLTEHWGWEAFGQEDSDRFRGSLQRSLWGSGPRFQAALGPDATLAVGVAYM